MAFSFKSHTVLLWQGLGWKLPHLSGTWVGTLKQVEFRKSMIFSFSSLSLRSLWHGGFRVARLLTVWLTGLEVRVLTDSQGESILFLMTSLGCHLTSLLSHLGEAGREACSGCRAEDRTSTWWGVARFGKSTWDGKCCHDHFWKIHSATKSSYPWMQIHRKKTWKKPYQTISKPISRENGMQIYFSLPSHVLCLWFSRLVLSNSLRPHGL